MPKGRDLLTGAQSKRSEEHTSELQSRSDLVCRLLLEKKKKKRRREKRSEGEGVQQHNDGLMITPIPVTNTEKYHDAKGSNRCTSQQPIRAVLAASVR